MKEGNIRLDVSMIDGKPLNPQERAEAESRAKAIVLAATHFNDPTIVAEACEDCLGAMKGLAVGAIEEEDMMQNRGW
jgi:pyridoxal 5'-phosphate synthase pdxS subunit